MVLYLIILVFTIILFKIAIPSKGLRGEKRVSKILKKLNQEEYTVFNDLTLKNDNSTSQIDHLIISTYGIFIVELKIFLDGYMVQKSQNIGFKIYIKRNISLETQ